MKDSNRTRRVAELLKRELAVLIPKSVRDPHVGRVTLTYADVSPDMANAKIYFTLLGSTEQAKDTERALNRAAGFLRHELRERVVLRSLPQLRFHYDESVERGARLTSLIDRAIAEDQTKKKDAETE
jgi:ribosome-binding factor A